MSLRQGIQSFQQDAPVRVPEDDSDAEEDVLVNDYKEQVRYDQNGLDDLNQTISHGSGGQDIHAQLAAAATPLEFQATLETKFASYDNYCSLFHFILNSEGPVDLEVPSVYNAVISRA
jgi:translation initiation factor 3 subunit L